MTPEERIDAAELALGLLEGEERVTALERVLAEPEFAAELAWWRSRLEVLHAEYGPTEPSAALAGRIEARIDAEAGVTAATRNARRWPWLVGGLAGGALAASLAALVLTQTTPAPTPVPSGHQVEGPLLVAALVPAKGQVVAPVAAVVDHGSGIIRVAALATPRGRVAELWRIGADGVPRSLGLLAVGGATRLTLRPRTGPDLGDTLAISVEPSGGSPTGAPTGPVVATGVLSRG
ncbi:anti-sigma factor [Sphingomonas aerophila]|uniref:Anti-sigma-K factor RskA n=1 Tax=Sphingomonas aerophila TaxID=1344948 RepID=A0A7W9EW97_9SPHN|nr:anti-sigma factor [Sphingomonas aerophila]MBB5717081.1 anti-sigma-K factor RskA [Sphingomonas aerophila]